jgi:hypothetical protein
MANQLGLPVATEAPPPVPPETASVDDIRRQLSKFGGPNHGKEISELLSRLGPPRPTLEENVVGMEDLKSLTEANLHNLEKHEGRRDTRELT